MGSIIALFTGHFTVFALLSVSTDQPVFDFEILWDDILESDVFEAGVSFVIEHN